VLVCSCASEVAPPPDARPLPLDLNVVITGDAVTVYTNGSDLGATDCIGLDVFPAPGTTAWIADSVTCRDGGVTSCLTTISLRIGSTETPANISPGRRLKVTGHIGPAADGELVVEGCGGTASIALRAVAAPQPTLGVVEDPVTRALTATWSASPTAASAVIEVVNGTLTDTAHVTASPYTYLGQQGVTLAPFRAVHLTTLAPPTVVPTTFGPVRIWTGESALVVVEEETPPQQRSTSALTMSTSR
jgi:hypothetical protein